MPIVVVDHPFALARCLEIRREVFIVEQGVPEALEIDELDDLARDDCVHVLAFPDGSTELVDAVGAGRLWSSPDGFAKAQRIATQKAARGTGVGRAIMRALEDLARARGHDEVRLGAQLSAIPFYERIGYEAFGPVFDDAGIDHRMMRRGLAKDE